MGFFERYFAALDGEDPYSSLEMLSEDIAFSIIWSEDGKAKEFTGGKEDLRRFVEAGSDRRKWRHHILWSGVDGDGEVAVGETRYDDGTPVGTYLTFGQLDSDGKLVRYMATRTPVGSLQTLPRRV